MPESQGPLTGARALVVDDEPLVAAVTAAMLEWAGCEVTSVENATEALALVDEPGSEYRLVVTDLMMPGMTGLQLVEALAERGARTAVVLVSGYATALDGAELPGFARFLAKPFTPAHLKAVAEAAVLAQDQGNSTE
jgi:CheY-like chemotaxis protein